MKKLLFVLFFVNISAFVYSQSSEKKQSLKPINIFTETTHDFGNINETEGKVSYTFEVSNTGNADLLISNVQGTCNFIDYKWTKLPIASGKKGFVTVTYNPENRPGIFNQIITVSNNFSENPITLSIKGNVIQSQNKLSSNSFIKDTTQTLISIEQLIKDSRDGVEFINNDELIKRINANPKLILIDVRTKEEYDAGHLQGATWLERGIVEFTLARTIRDPKAEIIVYCLKGNRSALVVKALKRMGYQNVKSHIGLEVWLKAGLSIYNFLGELKMVKLREINAATNPVNYYLDKK